MSNEKKPKEEILLSVLEYLDRNGYKESFDILQQNIGIRYLENVRKKIEELLKNKKIDELILYINTCNKLNNDERTILIKLLKIRKFIELVYSNCTDRIDQKDSLQFLRNEITPLIENTELLNSLTKILFYKDMNQLKSYIQKNLSIYEDDKYILNQLCKVKITPLEQLYNAYNRTLIKNAGIYFDKYNIASLKNIDVLPGDESNEIKLLELSKNKQLIAIGLSNLNIPILELSHEKCDNNDILNINLIKILTISKNNENKENKINIINFSHDDKYLLVLINNSIINIYDINSGNIIHTFSNNKFINYCLFVSDKNNVLIAYEDKKITMLENNNNKFSLLTEDIYDCSFNIKQLLFSDFYNLIIVVPNIIKDIDCFDISTKKVVFNIEIKEDIFYVNISKTDGGKYLIINLSKNYPKIFLYNLEQKKIEKKYYGYVQKSTEVKCAFGGDKDQYVLSASEDCVIYLWDRNISGLPKYQFKEHLNLVNGVEMINSSIIVSISDDKTIKFWTSYDIEDVHFKNKMIKKENEMKIESEN